MPTDGNRQINGSLEKEVHTRQSLLLRTNEREMIIPDKTHAGSNGGIQSASKDAARPNAADEVSPTLPLAPALSPVIEIKEEADANATPGTYLDDGGKEIVKALEAIPIGSTITFASDDLGALLLPRKLNIWPRSATAPSVFKKKRVRSPFTEMKQNPSSSM